ncbi:MAG: hypothetical protein OHK0023_05620 [Anaerolineae bacterium]
MTWSWLTIDPAAQAHDIWSGMTRIALKGVILFVLANLVFALLDPMPTISRITVHNGLVAGRPRLPYGDNPSASFNLSLGSLEAMFATHTLHGTPKAADEYRVLVIGDSSVWGVLLQPEETLAGLLNQTQAVLPNGKRLRAYNLGYPVQSLAKDLLIMDYAKRYTPDVIVWLVTAESFAPDVQMSTQIVRENPSAVRDLIGRYALRLDPNDARFVIPDFFGKTIIGRRRQLADWLRLQFYGLTWSATQFDQQYPRAYEPRMEDFPDDMPQAWHGFTETAGNLDADALAFDVLRAGVQLAKERGIALLLINEPMFISSGENSDKRYNAFYPRWAYDIYRDALSMMAQRQSINYHDMWDAISADQFTDSAVHLTPAGSQQFAEMILPLIEQIAQPVP